MKTELPEPAEYYRPTRARELRQRAAWLAARQYLLLGLAGAGVLGITILLGVGHVLLPDSWFVLAFGVLPGLPVSLALITRIPAACRRQSTGLCAEADRLEAEHVARFGSLPDEVP
jgi:hypothetical protein